MRLIGIFVLIAAPVFAGEYAVLSTGARLHVDRHEGDGAKVRLYNGAGYTEIEQSLVQGFEWDGQVPAAPPAVALEPVVAIAPAPASLSPQELADAAADRYGLPRALVRSVMAAESGFAPGAISPKGAIGLMQLMPGTAQNLNVDPHDPAQNADAGARYLRDLLQKYDGRLWHALAAYNAGPGAVDKYKGVPPYRETIDYIKRIDTKYKKSLAATPAPTADDPANANRQ
jgi:soluble lytic murein transglycosylase-like protein